MKIFQLRIFTLFYLFLFCFDIIQTPNSCLTNYLAVHSFLDVTPSNKTNLISNIQQELSTYDDPFETSIIQISTQFPQIKHPFDDCGDIHAKHPKVETLVVSFEELKAWEQISETIKNSSKKYTDAFLAVMINKKDRSSVEYYKERFSYINNFLEIIGVSVRKGETTFIDEGEDSIVLSLIYDDLNATPINSNKEFEIIGSIDSAVLGRHFLAKEPTYDEGFYAAIASISDIGANGGDPQEMYLTIVNPIKGSQLKEFRRGIKEAAMYCNVELISQKDINKSHLGPMTVTATLIGKVPHGEQLKLSNGIKEGMNIYVIGYLGVEKINNWSKDIKYFKTNVYPKLRSSVLNELRGNGTASDVSDSLIKSIMNCMKFSKDVIAEIDLEKVVETFPRELKNNYSEDQILMACLAGGDSYGLVVITSNNNLESLHSQIIKIGKVLHSKNKDKALIFRKNSKVVGIINAKKNPKVEWNICRENDFNICI